MERCECGAQFWDNRRRVGPTGRGDFSILVFTCSICGALCPVFPERLGWKEHDWVRRWNLRCAPEMCSRDEKLKIRLSKEFIRSISS